MQFAIRILTETRNVMNSAPRIIRWHEGRVDRTKEHFELRYGSAKDGGWDEWIPAALVGPPTNGVLIVQFIVEPGDPRIMDIVRDVKEDIQFMCELNEPDHWNYFKYHCTTMSNWYGTIHWSFFDPNMKRSVSSEIRKDKQLWLFQNDFSAQTRDKPTTKTRSKTIKTPLTPAEREEPLRKTKKTATEKSPKKK
jgi:hypothetical protein